MQARFPSVFDCDGPYPWGAVEPKLPEEYDTLPEADKEEAENRFSEVRLKKFYEMASRKFNPFVFQAMDTMKGCEPIALIFHLVGRSWIDGPIPLKELLIRVYRGWDQIIERRGMKIPCPISFTEDEIRNAGQEAHAWADAYGKFESLRTSIAGKEGWVSHDNYEEAIQNFQSHKESLEKLRRQLEHVGGNGSS